MVINTYQTVSHDNHRSTVDTLEVMRGLVESQQNDPIVSAAVDGLQLRALDTDTQVQILWGWIKRYMKYVEDDVLMAKAGVDPWDKDLIHEPTLLLSQIQQNGYAEGDCDDYVTLFATLLANANDKAGLSFVTIKTPDQGPIWAHVYLYVYCPCGKRLVVDGSHGPFIGWEYSNPTELQEWRVRGVKPKTKVERKREQIMLVEDTPQMGLAGPMWEPEQMLAPNVGLGAVDWGSVDWGSVLANSINSAVSATTNILTSKYAVPPPGTMIQTQNPGGSSSIYTGVQPGAGGMINTPVGSGFGNTSTLALVGLGVVALVLLTRR